MNGSVPGPSPPAAGAGTAAHAEEKASAAEDPEAEDAAEESEAEVDVANAVPDLVAAKLDAVLKKYRRHPSFGLYFIPADDLPESLQVPSNADVTQELQAVPVKTKGDPIEEGKPQWIHGQHNAMGGMLRQPHNSLFAQTQPLEDGIVVNDFRQANAEAYLSTCKITDLPVIHKKLAAINALYTRCGLPEANCGLFRAYGQTGKNR